MMRTSMKPKSRNVAMTATVAGLLLAAFGIAEAGAQGIQILYCADQNPQTPLCEGTKETESLVGTDKRDVIRAFGGDDIINAERGADEAYGGSGVDNINGAYGNDELFGGGNQDEISDGVMENGELSTGDTDTLSGNAGNDILGSKDDDFLDTLRCGDGAQDVVFFDVRPRKGLSDAVAANCEYRNELPPGLTKSSALSFHAR